MRWLIGLIVFLAASSASSAQAPQGAIKPDEPTYQEPRAKRVEEVKQVVAPKKDFHASNRILFVVDTSGSMRDHYQQAVESVLHLVEVPIDDLQVALVTFSGSPVVWKGRPQPCQHAPTEKHTKKCVLEGWAELPEGYRAFRKYLATCPADGGTEPATALSIALAQPLEELTIVLVSDGFFSPEPVISALLNGQQWRLKKGLPLARLMVWGCGSAAEESVALTRLAKCGGGGFWIKRQQPKREDD